MAVPVSPKQRAPNLVANFLPVRFRGAAAFHAGVVPFESPERLVSLREELRGTHVVRRDADQVVCVPVVPDAPEVGKQRKFVIGEHRPLTMRLVREALVGQVIAMRYKLAAFARPTFISRYAQHDLLAQAAGGHQGALSQLHVYPEYMLDARVCGPSSQPGIIIGLKTRYEIDLTVAELIQHGLAAEGRYVLAETGEVPFNPDLDGHVYRKLTGAVESVRDGRLILRDAPVLAEVEADRAWVEGRRDVFQEVVALLTGGRQHHVLEMLEEAKFGLLGADGRLNRITALARRLGEAGPLKIANEVQVEIGLPIGSPLADASVVAVKSTEYGEPVFVFDPAGDKTSKSAERGLAEFGPFDSQFFTPRRPRIVVLTPRGFQGTAEIFMDQFRRGVPDSNVYTQGFARKYRLADCDVVIDAFDAGPRDAAAYRDACLAVAQSADKPDLAVVVTSEAQEGLQGDDSPYLVAKSTLMGQGIPVQEVQFETMRRGNPASTLDSMALQCYAKLSGIPYVIAAPRTITHELVVGIGSAHVNPSRFGTPERVVGITTVFSADGNYILSNTSREADYDRYPQELLRALQVSIDDVQKRNAWQPEDAIRLIVHVFKPLKETEAGAVKQLVKNLLSEYRSVEFAFVHISDEHSWALFDTNAPGRGNAQMPSGQRQPIARSVPRRGHAVIIGPGEILLTVKGPYDVKIVTQGLPQPLLLKLHPASTFTDIEYLAGQAFRFTAISWRRFYPSGRPVTILYSDLIASLLGRLRHVKNWNADIISTKFRTSRWFL
jgi:hypothetical protein